MLITLIAGVILGCTLWSWVKKLDFEEHEKALNYKHPLQPTVLRVGYCANCIADRQLNVYGGCLACGSKHTVPLTKTDWEQEIRSKAYRDSQAEEVAYAVGESRSR